MNNNEIKRIEALQDRENATIEGVILEVFEPKEITRKTGEALRLQEVLVDDGYNSIILTLWADDINSLKQNERVRIVNGYVTEYKGNKKISKGKYGKIEKLNDKAT